MGSAQWGMSAQGSVCLGRAVCLGECLPKGASAQRGVCLVREGCLPHHSPVNRMTDRCKNITLLQTLFAGGNKLFLQSPVLNIGQKGVISTYGNNFASHTCILHQ